MSAAVAGAETGIPASGRLAFVARRNGAVLGSHVLRFARAEGRLTVDIAVDYSVKVGFVRVFRYRLRAREVWVDGQTAEITAETDNNGRAERMRAVREDGVLMVEGTRAARYAAPEGALLCAHWNIAQLGRPLINPQDGTLLRFAVHDRGAARVTDAQGRLCAARRWALEGRNALDLWYDAAGIWLALQAKAEDGSTITYQAAA